MKLIGQRGEEWGDVAASICLQRGCDSCFDLNNINSSQVPLAPSLLQYHFVVDSMIGSKGAQS